jgi:hypothetical protein
MADLSSYVGKTFSYMHGDGLTPALGVVDGIDDAGQFVMDNGHKINAQWLLNNGDIISESDIITDIIPEDEFDYQHMGIEPVNSDQPIDNNQSHHQPPPNPSHDPIHGLINKMKTTEVFIDVPIKVNLITKEMFDVLNSNFKDGEFLKGLVTKVLGEIDPNNLKEIISKSIEKHYNNG